MILMDVFKGQPGANGVGGYQWHEATSGKLSIQELVSYKPKLVLLDLGRPDMDGVGYRMIKL